MKQLVIVVGLTLAAALSAQAQATRTPDVPRDHRPPAGMCRVWLDNVPAGQQPAPTDCASAVRNRPSNGRVIFGDDYVQPESRKAGDRDRGVNLLRGFVRPNGFAAPAPPREEKKPDEKKPDEKRPDDKKKPERPDR